MQAIQYRRERENRQVNERLRTLIAAYKTLGGSFTGDLLADPAHLRDLRRGTSETQELQAEDSRNVYRVGSDRSRRIRDAVEGALSDIILLGTERQVHLAAHAAAELAAGRAVETAELVVCLRQFIRQVLDLEPISPQVQIPKQGPARAILQKSNKERGSDNVKSGGGGGGLGASAGGAGLNESEGTGDDEHHG